MYHALLEPKMVANQIRDIAVIRVQCKGKTEGYKSSFTLELIETYDEETGFTAMEKLTGLHASITAILVTKGKLPKGAAPVENVFLGKTLAYEINHRGWKTRNITLTET